MDEKLRKQIEEALAKTEARLDKAERQRTLELFDRCQSIELPPESDRSWLLRQFRICGWALRFTKGAREARRLMPLILFTMGQAYERYYVSKKP